MLFNTDFQIKILQNIKQTTCVITIYNNKCLHFKIKKIFFEIFINIKIYNSKTLTKFTVSCTFRFHLIPNLNVSHK